MLEWLKSILGTAYTPEIDAAVSQEIGKGFVARTDFNKKNARAAELEAQVGQLEEQAKTYAAQLKELETLTGDNAELKKKLEDMAEQAKADKAAYEKELAQVKLLSAVDAELTAAGAKNNTAARALLADFLAGAKVVDGKVTAKVDGESVTLSARLESMKQDAATSFLFGAVTREGWTPGEPSGGQKPGGKKPSEMTYAELEEYLASNPGAGLE